MRKVWTFLCFALAVGFAAFGPASQAMADVSVVSVSTAPPVAGATSKYDVMFTAGTGAVTPGITVVFAPGTTVPCSITTADVTIKVGGGAFTPATGITFPNTPDCTTVRVTTADTVNAGDMVTVTFALTSGIKNPTVSGGKMVSVYTSAEPAPVTSAAYTIIPDQPHHFAVSAGATQTAGNGFSVTLSAQDQYNNPLPGYSSVGSMHWTTTANPAPNSTSPALPADAPLTFDAGGQATVPGVTLYKAETGRTLTVTDQGNSISGNSNSLALAAGGLNRYVFTNIGTKTAGNVFTVAIQAQDQWQNPIANHVPAVNLHWTTSAGQAPDGISSPSLPVDSKPTFNATGTANIGGFDLFRQETGVAISVAEGAATGTSNTFNVTHNIIAQFGIANVANQTAGVGFSVTVTAQDQFANPIGNYAPANNLQWSTDAGPAPNGSLPGLPADAKPVFDANGQTTVSGFALYKAELARTLTLTETVLGFTGSSLPFDVAGGPMVQYIMSPVGTRAAGGGFSVTVTATDQWQNGVPNYVPANTLHWTTTAGNAPNGSTPIIPADAIPAFNASGQATIGGFSLYKAETGAALTVTQAVTGYTGTSPGFNVNVGALNRFLLSNIGNQAAGGAFAVTVTAQDAWQNPMANYTPASNLHWTTTGGTAPDGTTLPALPADSRPAFDANGQLTVSSLRLYKAETARTLTIREVGLGTTATTNTFDVGVGPVNRFAVGNVAGQTAGGAFAVTITAQDQWHNPLANYAPSGNLHWTTTAGTAPDLATQPALPADSMPAFDANGQTTVSGFTLYRAETGRALTVTESAVSATGISNTFDVSPGGVNRFALSSPGNQTAGGAFGVTATAQDQWQNAIPGYTPAHPLHWTTTAGTAPDATTVPILPADAQPAFNASGQAAVSGFTLYRAQAGVTLTLTETTTTYTGTSAGFNVSAGAISRFGVENPGAQITGLGFGVTVTAQDAWQNPLANYAPAHNLHWSTTAGTAPNGTSTPALPADGMPTFDAAGQSAVNGFTLFKAETGRTLTVQELTTATTGVSGAFAVDALDPDHFSVVPASTNTSPGSAFGVTVSARDAYGNLVPGYTGTVHFTSNDAAATLPVDYTFVAGDNGSHIFTAALTTAGSRTITVTGPGEVTVIGTSPGITVSAVSPPPVDNPVLTSVTVSGPATVIAGGQATYIATAFSDQGGIMGANFTWSASGGTISNGGVWTAPTKLGTFTITATTGNVSKSVIVTVVPAAAAKIMVQPAGAVTVQAGETLTFTAVVTDAYDNPTTGANLVWTLRGVGTVGGGIFMSTKVGSATVIASLGALTGESGVITVVPGDPSLVTISPNPAGGAAGETIQFQAQVSDRFGNAVPGAITWRAGGGTIDQAGLFTAGDGPTATVTASAGSAGGSVTVTIAAPPTGPGFCLSSGPVTPSNQAPPPGAKVIQPPVIVAGTGQATVRFNLPQNQILDLYSLVYYFDQHLTTWIAVPTRVEGSCVIAMVPAGVPAALLQGRVRQFPDSGDNWAIPFILKLESLGMMDGYPDGDFRPDGPVTRYEAAKTLALVLGLNYQNPDLSVLETQSDYRTMPDWAKPYVAAVLSKRVMVGFDIGFMGDIYLDRAQMATILGRLLPNTPPATLQFADNADIPWWAKDGTEKSVASGIIVGFPDGRFHPHDVMTRAQMAKMLSMLFDYLHAGN